MAREWREKAAAKLAVYRHGILQNPIPPPPIADACAVAWTWIAASQAGYVPVALTRIIRWTHVAVTCCQSVDHVRARRSVSMIVFQNATPRLAIELTSTSMFTSTSSFTSSVSTQVEIATTLPLPIRTARLAEQQACGPVDLPSSL